MSHTLKIPMTKEFLNELDDTFVDQQKSAHRFIFELITGLCRDAKNCKLAKNTPVNRWVDKKRIQETVKFKDIKLDDYTLPSDPDWLPKDTDVEDMTSFNLKVRDKTMEYLKLHGQILLLRIKEYHNSTNKHEESILDDLRKSGTVEEGIKKQEEQNQTSKELRESQIPKCLEQAIYSQIFPTISQTVDKNIDKEFMAEFDEEYADIEKKRSEGIKKRSQEKKKKEPRPSPKR
jgi:hypothetical protein